MKVPSGQLLKILRIGHNTSLRGVGISLRDALAETHYKELRPRLCSSDFLPYILANPVLVDEWIAYSEDKRTSGGWYLLPQGEIGQSDRSDSSQQYATLPEAVSEYVVRELDYWAGIDA